MSEVTTQDQVTWTFDPETVVAEVTESRVPKVTARAAIKVAFKKAIKDGDFALVAKLDKLDDEVSAIRAAKVNVGPTVDQYAAAIMSRAQSLFDAATRLSNGTYIPKDVPAEMRDQVAAAIKVAIEDNKGKSFEVPTKSAESVRDWAVRNVIARSSLDEHFASIVAGQARTASGQPFPFDQENSDRVFSYSEIAAARTDSYPAGVDGTGRISARFVAVGDRAPKCPTGWEYATTAKGGHGCKFVGA